VVPIIKECNTVGAVAIVIISIVGFEVFWCSVLNQDPMMIVSHSGWAGFVMLLCYCVMAGIMLAHLDRNGFIVKLSNGKVIHLVGNHYLGGLLGVVVSASDEGYSTV